MIDHPLNSPKEVGWKAECLFYRIDSLRRELKRLADKDHPYPEPNIIYSALLAVLKDREDILLDAVSTYSLGPRRARGLINLDAIVEDLRGVAYLFNLAHRVDSARIPFEILKSLSWASMCVLPGPCSAVVRLDPSYNYSIVSFRKEFAQRGWIDFWFHSLEREKYPRNQNVLLFGFPSPEVGSILVHGIAAHELGHLVAELWEREIEEVLDRNLMDVKRKYSEQIGAYIADHIVRQPPGRGVPRSDAYEAASREVEARLLEISGGWLTEMFADFVAARLVGPSFIAAFDRVTLGFGRAVNTHPPGQFRRSLVRRFLTHALPHIAADPIWAEVLEAGSWNSEPEDLPFRIAADVCALSFDSFVTLVQRINSPLDKNPVQLREELMDMQLHVEHLSPPSVPLKIGDEIETANMFWLLLYGAWSFRLSKERFYSFVDANGWRGDLGRAEAALGNIVIHALESLDLRFRWRNYLEAKDDAFKK